MSKILIFGSTGFIGQNFITGSKLDNDFRLIAPTRNACNLLNFTQTQNFIKKIKPGIILNLAYYGGVTSAIKYSQTNLVNNIKIATNILNSVKGNLRIKKIFFLSSSLSKEPKNTYAHIKAQTTSLSLALAKKWQLPLVILRPYNLYGPHDRRTVVYRTIASILKKQAFSLTAGRQKRDYLFIQDFVKILDLVVENWINFENYETYDIGSGKAVQMKQVFSRIFKLLNFKGPYQTKDYSPDEYWYQKADTKKVKAAIGRFQITLLESGLKQTISWIRESL
ncbi:hypothetical protein A2774_03055 [Candidatus Roizmanbacteria bacterium RIFCSPHIGHO2_01_FULL_39_12c]|uniref:NAD-dependent epimerase/dehydratase domain-containing protein n=1 Tax=Candidatus Roizmanbacteria bacterium RIFCSPHIGHO2_01_FULL_39_12c TaxID=1802031 RepID=A0A1F7GBV4_9BACT|nr:MAG: hypothetical protein A2774_03055 [Candidatus Roizmanbacteria bacterium RIFCSPHIGHO2_01_FULL_39_12c]OGK47422.1 MAG: hypothetical protein A2963_04685 [Candidatus Roizmanbacteria bacterium RIFCSPLOWO2_01_FULL_40_13]